MTKATAESLVDAYALATMLSESHSLPPTEKATANELQETLRDFMVFMLSEREGE